MQIQKINVQINKNNSYQKQNTTQKSNSQPSFGMIEEGSHLATLISTDKILKKIANLSNFEKMLGDLNYITENRDWLLQFKQATVVRKHRRSSQSGIMNLLSISPTSKNKLAELVPSTNDGDVIDLYKQSNWLDLGKTYKGEDYGITRAAELMQKLEIALTEHAEQYKKDLEVFKGIPHQINTLKADLAGSGISDAEAELIQGKIDALSKMTEPKEKKKMEYILSEIDKSVLLPEQKPEIVANSEKHKPFNFLNIFRTPK